MEAFYFKGVIPQITNSISVWGNCSVSKLTEIENLHIKADKSRNTHSESSTQCIHSEVLDYIKWQDLGYIYIYIYRRILIENSGVNF